MIDLAQLAYALLRQTFTCPLGDGPDVVPKHGSAAGQQESPATYMGAIADTMATTAAMAAAGGEDPRIGSANIQLQVTYAIQPVTPDTGGRASPVLLIPDYVYPVPAHHLYPDEQMELGGVAYHPATQKVYAFTRFGMGGKDTRWRYDVTAGAFSDPIESFAPYGLVILDRRFPIRAVSIQDDKIWFVVEHLHMDQPEPIIGPFTVATSVLSGEPWYRDGMWQGVKAAAVAKMNGSRYAWVASQENSVIARLEWNQGLAEAGNWTYEASPAAMSFWDENATDPTTLVVVDAAGIIRFCSIMSWSEKYPTLIPSAPPLRLQGGAINDICIALPGEEDEALYAIQGGSKVSKLLLEPASSPSSNSPRAISIRPGSYFLNLGGWKNMSVLVQAHDMWGQHIARAGIEVEIMVDGQFGYLYETEADMEDPEKARRKISGTTDNEGAFICWYQAHTAGLDAIIGRLRGEG